MTDSNVFKLNKPEQNDPLQEVLREEAHKMLAAAIETEVRCRTAIVSLKQAGRKY